jgi:hypothetical protein
VTNGLRGLRRLRWADLFSGEQDITLSARIVAAPLVLPPGPAGLRAIVATFDDTLTLVEGPELKTHRTWRLPGKLTTGPFALGSGVALIVAGRRVLWIDPTKDGVAWEYPTTGDGIIGQPQLAGGLLVIADISGQIVGIDPATGKAVGQGYTLQASAAPAATPVAFGEDRILLPLTDGTAVLLPLARLRDGPAKAPLIW